MIVDYQHLHPTRTRRQAYLYFLDGRDVFNGKMSSGEGYGKNRLAYWLLSIILLTGALVAYVIAEVLWGGGEY